MSFAHVGNVGSASQKRSGLVSDQDVTTSVTFSSAVSVGQLLVAWFGTTLASNPSDLNNGILLERIAFHDSAGNRWTTIVGHGEPGSIMGSIACTRVSQALTTSDTLDVTHRVQISNGQGTAAVSVHEFDCDPDLRWARFDVSSGNFVSAGTDPPGISGYPGGNFDGREYLVLHLLVALGPDSDAYTWDSDYTQITGAGTTGGADTTNIHIRGGFRILTSSGTDTIDVTSDTADRETLEQVASLCEVPYLDEFPMTAVVDDFNRADEDPVSQGGRWHQTDSAGPSDASADFLEVVSNQAAAAGTVAGGTGGGSWYQDEHDGDSDGEAYVTIATAGVAHVSFNGSGAAEDSTNTQLSAKWQVAGTTPRNIADGILVGGSGPSDGSGRDMFRTWVDCADGVKFGIQRTHPDMHLWVDTGDGWEWAGAVHASDSALAGFTAGGYLGLGAHDATVRLDDFGGGPMWKPQFYRVP